LHANQADQPAARKVGGGWVRAGR